MKLGLVLKELRIKKGKTQNEVCRKVKIAQSYLSLIENDEKEPAPETLRTLCDYYDVPAPVVIFMAMEEKDVRKSRRNNFNKIKPAIDALINEFVNSDTPKKGFNHED